MSNKRKILIVEGEADKGFFTQLCKKLELDTTVRVALPKDVSVSAYNTKGGVLQQLSLLKNQLEDGSITHIAAIVDADYVKHGGGVQKTITQVEGILKPFGFDKRASEAKYGIHFDHDDGLPSIGLWIMPNNLEEGMLEDWVKDSIAESESDLFSEASFTVQKISKPKFKPHLTVKAEVATWLAWQTTPGHGLYNIIYSNLLSEEKDGYSNLCGWLREVFH